MCYFLHGSHRRCSSPFLCTSLNWVSIIMLENILCCKLSKRPIVWIMATIHNDVFSAQCAPSQFDHLKFISQLHRSPKIYFWFILWGLSNNCTFLTRLREKALKKHNLSRYKFQEFAFFIMFVEYTHKRDSCKRHGFDRMAKQDICGVCMMKQWFSFQQGCIFLIQNSLMLWSKIPKFPILNGQTSCNWISYANAFPESRDF